MKQHPRVRALIRAVTLYTVAFFIGIALVSSTRTSAKRHVTANSQSAGASGYHLLKTIPVPGDTGWDYLKFDPSSKQLFISRGDHVAVVNVETGSVVADIGGMQRIHGIVLAPEFNRGFVTDGQAAKVCGAGGGGCVIFLVEPGAASRVATAIGENGGRVLPLRLAKDGLIVTETPGNIIAS